MSKRKKEMDLLGTRNGNMKWKIPWMRLIEVLEAAKEKISELEDITIETQWNELHFHFRNLGKNEQVKSRKYLEGRIKSRKHWNR